MSHNTATWSCKGREEIRSSFKKQCVGIKTGILLVTTEEGTDIEVHTLPHPFSLQKLKGLFNSLQKRKITFT